MSASITSDGLVRFSGSVRRVISGDLEDDLVKNIQDAAPRIVTEMKGAAFTRIQRRAASSVTADREAKGARFTGGGGGGLGAILFDGGEYGGRKSKKVSYATRSPLGTPYIVRRRTTMQFLPHLGREGYFYWPTIRDWMPKLAKEQEDIVERALGRGVL